MEPGAPFEGFLIARCEARALWMGRSRHWMGGQKDAATFAIPIRGTLPATLRPESASLPTLVPVGTHALLLASPGDDQVSGHVLSIAREKARAQQETELCAKLAARPCLGAHAILVFRARSHEAAKKLVGDHALWMPFWLHAMFETPELHGLRAAGAPLDLGANPFADPHALLSLLERGALSESSLAPPFPELSRSSRL